MKTVGIPFNPIEALIMGVMGYACGHIFGNKYAYSIPIIGLLAGTFLDPLVSEQIKMFAVPNELTKSFVGNLLTVFIPCVLGVTLAFWGDELGE